MLRPGGVLIENGQRLSAVDVLARASGNAVALPWRTDRAPAAARVIEDLDDLAVLADSTAAGAELVAAIRALAGGPTPPCSSGRKICARGASTWSAFRTT